MTSANPLLAPSTLPNQAPPFDKIEDAHYAPAIEEGLKRARAELDAIKSQPAAPTFENTVVALETMGEALSHVMEILGNQISAAATPALVEIKQSTAPQLAEFYSSVAMDDELFARIKAVWNRDHDNPALSIEQRTLLKNTYDGFRRSGALLNDKDKTRMKEINIAASTLGTEFNENIKNSMEAFSLIVNKEEDLSGLPEDVITAAKARAEKKGSPGAWLFTLDYPSYGPFITYADNRDLRERIWRAFGCRAWKDQYDNQNTIKQIVRLSYESANLLGYPTPAHFVLEDRMSEKPETVFAFLGKLKGAYKDAAVRDLDALKKFAASHGGPAEIKPWDVAYYSEKMKEDIYGFSSEDLRPYFPLEKVLCGCFEHFSRQFGVVFTENPRYPTWAADVKAFDVTDKKTGVFIGTLYADFHPRSGKKPGAWMTGYRSQGLFGNKIERPIIAIVCNFTEPLPEKPSLLTHDEVLTLFHEMGHAMHGLLSDVTYRSLASPNVKWDFVELPSQVQENWAYTRETLDLISGHWQTGEKIPGDLFRKLNDSKNFMVASMGLRQVNLATLDMLWYTTNPEEIEEKYGFDVFKFEEDVTKDTRLFPMLAGPTSTSFSHIFGGGYASGYNSYKWAEVLDADAFYYMTEHHVYDEERLMKYRREILERGGTEHPSILYRNFRGQDADPDALLRREGLIDGATSKVA
ncbi:MAG: M3 family metallopeptidase [Micavibrio aeruginosavorus]|uniref:M3 family metallopeptidase n=1 Tax=Micavibrio aeruginosavorus TaxID=349221 RepID=A0A7T5R4E2_9BACT|nr:MAG: M3 family metallopeptidase [Micavibrio aeruginosavorus]